VQRPRGLPAVVQWRAAWRLHVHVAGMLQPEPQPSAACACIIAGKTCQVQLPVAQQLASSCCYKLCVLDFVLFVLRGLQPLLILVAVCVMHVSALVSSMQRHCSE
jgi:hypothetical protein